MAFRWTKILYPFIALALAGTVFSFLPANPNAVLIKPLLAPRETVQADIGVVLGAGLKLDGSLSNVAKERVDYAVRLHEQTGLPLLFSGGETPSGVEAVVMNTYAKEHGYAGLEHMEASSHSTYQNATFTLELLNQERFPDNAVLVITSPYHSRRALATFRKVMPNRRVFVAYPDETAVLADTVLGRWQGFYTLMREYAANLWYAAAYRVKSDMQPSQFSKGEKLDFRMADGTRLQADYYAGQSNKAVLLLHQMRMDRHAWDSLIPALQEKGWHVLAVDARGHGQSEGDWHRFTDKDYAQMPIDAIALATWLQQNHGPLTVVAVGASIGANSALRAAALADQVQAVAALSPGPDYHGVTTLDVAARLRVPVLYVSAKDDQESAAAFPALLNNTAAAKQDKELVMFETGGHGNALLQSQPSLIDTIVSFIDAL